MDAVDGVEALISRIRFDIDELEEQQQREAVLDAELRSMGIDPAALDDEGPDDERRSVAPSAHCGATARPPCRPAATPRRSGAFTSGPAAAADQLAARR